MGYAVQKGTIDELKIYNRALTLEEVLADYKRTNRESSGKCSEVELGCIMIPNLYDVSYLHYPQVVKETT
ncbi:hypothetical protein J2T13_002183 [Paenibacillus sp. DS2015]